MSRLALLLLLALMLGACGSNRPFIRQEFLLGTTVAVKFHGDQENAKKASDEIFVFLQELHNTVNVFAESSEISKLNETAFDKDFVCSELLWDIIDKSRKGYEISDGYFDISAGPLMKLWGFHRKRKQFPSDKEIAERKKVVGLDKVIFTDSSKSVRFSVKGMFLDFGGIAKGYALDRCRDIAVNNGVDCGIIDLGGNVYSFPKPPAGKNFYQIGIRKPSGGGVVDVLETKDSFIATSGDYERFVVIDNKRVTHIINPFTGMPVENVASVSVLTKGGFESDVLSTAIFVGGREFARKVVGEYPELQYMIISSVEGEFKYSVYGDIWHRESTDE